MTVYMIRHGAVKGNLERRYVGSTDESLLPREAERLGGYIRKKVDRVYASPMKRCLETAEILYPGMPCTVIEDFRECGFGAFEYCNYEQLNGHPAYQKYIDTMGESAFPGGESRREFQGRCVKAFRELAEELLRTSTVQVQDTSRQVQDTSGKNDAGFISSVALVVHGGTIMALLDAFSVPHRDYFCWQAGNGEGFAMELEITGNSEDNREYRLCNIRPLDDAENVF